jgi:hypothetical protein
VTPKGVDGELGVRITKAHKNNLTKSLQESTYMCKSVLLYVAISTAKRVAYQAKLVNKALNCKNLIVKI